ncbi:MAG: class V aminotransferase [Phenylobacterium zucineum]|nr:MAG: class V aminotransferase [Phenylobacterium zucineum]
MQLSRRGLVGAGALLPGLASASVAASPERARFPFEGVYLDAAFTHPLGTFVAEAADKLTRARLAAPQAVGPRGNPRRGAVERFARLINAAPTDIAVVPSTLAGENMLAAALGIGPGAGVVTDALHYDASLALYGELGKRGAPVAVARPREDGRVDLADLRDLITPQTRLVAVSLVSSATGFEHDLAELCAVAHARGALVYADIIQAAGAIPVDVRASGVDFACCGTYKWLMGDFGAAFLYVHPDRLDRLKRVEVGWRQIRRQDSHVFPFEPPGPALGAYELAHDAAGLFEVSTPAWGALAAASAGMDYVLARGVQDISHTRQPLTDAVFEGLAGLGFRPLTAKGARSPIVAFAAPNLGLAYSEALRTAGITVSLYRHRVRVSASVYNTTADVERFINVFASAR